MASDKTLEFPKNGTKLEERVTQVVSASAQMVVMCGCGSRTPLMVHLVPGVELKTTCPVCRRVIKAGRFIFDATKGDSLSVGVLEGIPSLIQPANGMIVDK